VESQPDNSPSVAKAAELMKTAAKGKPVTVDWTFKKLNGQNFFSRLNISRFKLKGEIYYQFSIVDLTKELKSTGTHFGLDMAVEQAAEPIFITDVDGIIGYVNNALLETSGFNREELLGQKFDMILADIPDSEDLWRIRHALMEKQYWSGNINLKGKKNHKVEVISTVTPVRSITGEVNSYLVISRNIAEESRIQTYLRQAQKMETIGTLAGGIAHDFNNILTTIIGHSDMAMKDLPEESSAKDDLIQILKATDRAKGLVNQILTFSRQVDQKDTRVEPATLINEILKLMSASLPQNIRIVQDMNKKCPLVSTDPSQLHQVIMNILTNGIYAMKDQGGTLTITVDSFTADKKFTSEHPSLSKGEYVRMIFTDTGKGMDSAVKERIFEPFFTTKPVGEGTGLGLSVVHGIIKNLKGEILVDSIPGKGSVFTVLLPAE
jgi:PAS domain S-box-containing protein